ncbi:MAG: galactosamine-6-phosphate isomerase [Bacteroidetes bacterium]|nr:MAG: galactosamine-6-phosphate isomerase [Bacteroidota bacterium]
MQFFHCGDDEKMSRAAARAILAHIQKNPRACLGIATGNSPARCYELLAEHARVSPGFFDQTTLVQLDEWVGLAPDHPASCAFYIRKKLLEPLGLSPENAFLFNGAHPHPATECRRANDFLDARNGLDLCILGVGKNGHLGFNEPATRFSKRTHLTPLEPLTQTHAMVKNVALKPTFGISLGMEDLTRARHICLLFSGAGKGNVYRFLQTREVSPSVPVSALWAHPDTQCFVGDIRDAD